MSEGVRTAVGPLKIVGAEHACAKVPIMTLPEYTDRAAAGSNAPVGPEPMRLGARARAREEDRVAIKIWDALAFVSHTWGTREKSRAYADFSMLVFLKLLVGPTRLAQMEEREPFKLNVRGSKTQARI